MNDEHKPQVDHGQDHGHGAAAGHGHDAAAHAPAAEAQSHDAPGPDAPGPDAPGAAPDPDGQAQAAAHSDPGHDAPAGPAHGDDDHGHPAAPQDDHTPAAAQDDHAHDAPPHDAHAPDDHVAQDAAPAEAGVAAAGVAGVAGAAARSPVWNDSGDAPFEDVDTTPVYARGKGGRRSGSSGGSSNEGLEIFKTIFFALLIALVLRVVLFQPFTIPSASMEPALYEGDYIVVSKWSYGYSKHAIPFSPPIFEGRILAREPERGDIVVFKLPRDNSTDYIKRLIGLPGDRIQMIANVLHINGTPLSNVVVTGADVTNMYGMSVVTMRETLPEGRVITIQDFGPGNDLDDTPVFEVPAGHYFMMGDNRDNSIDSRVIDPSQGVGLVPSENLIGKAEIILFSWSPGATLWNPISWFSNVRPSRFFTVLD